MATPSHGPRDRTGFPAFVVGSVFAMCLAVTGCGSAGGSAIAPTAAPGTPSPAGTGAPVTAVPSSVPAATAIPSEAAGEGITLSGDVPDNAVFLPYADRAHGFSIQYVEGWQVRPVADGVEIRDKDSSETVALVSGATDVAGYVRDTDLPALNALPRFSLVKEDVVHVGALELSHLTYHLPAPPDPVSGKQVPSTVERYYVPGASGLAVVTLSTPDGVDNVDAFRQMIESFAWTS